MQSVDQQVINWHMRQVFTRGLWFGLAAGFLLGVNWRPKLSTCWHTTASDLA